MFAQNVRDRVMKQFREGQVRILVATDVVGRGIDVSSLSHIVNYDIPEFCDDYVHRVGRTGRMGREGVAYTFVSPEEGPQLTRIEMRIERLLIVATDLGAATVMFWGMGLLVLVPFIVSSIAINLRRLHDRDKSGWWLLVFYLVPVALAVFAQAAVGSSPESSVTKVAESGTLALQFLMIVELGFLPGTRGGNQYGEDPRASQPA